MPHENSPSCLTVDLEALGQNYNILKTKFTGAHCAAVVKADGYGLGLGEIAGTLERAGCSRFFVATIDEGMALRKILPHVQIAVLNGAIAGTSDDLAAHNLIPVLNDLAQIENWSRKSQENPKPDAIIHIDTGMNRLGLPPYDVEKLIERTDLLEKISVSMIMSHLACAGEPDNPLNQVQRQRLDSCLIRLADAPASLANSSGIFLGPEFHFDIARPGAALYGINPTPNLPNPMFDVVRLQSQIIQIRKVDANDTVGYGASYRFSAPSLVATVPVGYADGYLRSTGNRAFVGIGGRRAAVVGRVSMDLITIDITSAADEFARVGTPVDIIGGPCSVDDVAEWGGTIGYEILTGLGNRYSRRYINGPGNKTRG